MSGSSSGRSASVTVVITAWTVLPGEPESL